MTAYSQTTSVNTVTNDTSIVLPIQGARIVAKGLIRFDSLAAVHSITLEKLDLMKNVIEDQRKMITVKDSIILTERERNKQSEQIINLKDKEVNTWKETAVISEKKYKKEKLKKDVSNTIVVGLVTTIIVLLLSR